MNFPRLYPLSPDAAYDELLSQLREKSLFRELRTIDEVQDTVVRIGDRFLVNFASNDYLGLSQHPLVKAAAKRQLIDSGQDQALPD
jgi:7-keto-8-aminopelargonate synthetase-like enzyme